VDDAVDPPGQDEDAAERAMRPGLHVKAAWRVALQDAGSVDFRSAAHIAEARMEVEEEARWKW
jgi:hypothetical protein